MNDIMTIRGNVGGDPVRNTIAGGATVLNFRVATSQGYRDKRTGQWVETGTNWYSVSAFRQLADNAKVSLRSGDAVIVTGKLKMREWDSNGRHGVSADITADTIGHDLTRGTSNFMRTPRAAAAPTPSAGAEASDARANEHGHDPMSQESPPTDAGEDFSDDSEAWTPPGGLHLLDAETGEVIGRDDEHDEADEGAYADA